MGALDRCVMQRLPITLPDVDIPVCCICSKVVQRCGKVDDRCGRVILIMSCGSEALRTRPVVIEHWSTGNMV